jgi:hypothetical protein
MSQRLSFLVVLLTVPLAATACDPGHEPDAGNEPMVSTTIDVVCNADGTTELHNFDVVTSPDGVHFHVDNRAGETVSLNGTGRDFRKGVSEQTSQIPPGEYEIACWPGSLHSGEEPETQTVRVTDPDGLFVRPAMRCPKGQPTSGSVTLDYGSNSRGTEGEPTDVARDVLRGLEPADELILVGYPEAEFPQVAVVRDGDQIANLRYSPSELGGWLLGGYSACDPDMVDI